MHTTTVIVCLDYQRAYFTSLDIQLLGHKSFFTASYNYNRPHSKMFIYVDIHAHFNHFIVSASK